jgi:hypothetical protein
MVPKYVNCNNRTMIVCEFYMHRDCRETCAYAKEIRGLGIGAMASAPLRKLKSEKLIQELDKSIEGRS